jgi:hypothetical protein
MSPPVALLVYLPGRPREAVFYPFAIFSPEWVAIQYGNSNQCQVRFMDLPQAFQLGRDDTPDASPPDDNVVRQDPIGYLAQAAGYSDSERWWEQLVEHRRTNLDVFSAIQEAMTVLRDTVGADLDIRQRRREAFMRQTIRKALHDGYSKIAVVCGAWHAPALATMPAAKDDAELLSSLTKSKVAVTWVPWTYGRLAHRSGYGAGIVSPGWYGHLWETDENITVHWMSKVSRLLREHDLGGSPAHIIEAVRLAETLASLRERSLPGLLEMNESVQAVFTFGSSVPLKLIAEQMIISDRLGKVPPSTPTVPLQKDIEKAQKSLRLPPEILLKSVDLDLRKETDLARSHLLHRLNIIAVPWGKIQKVVGAKGTFHELWKLEWKPQFVVSIIEASVWGNTIIDAVDAHLRESADHTVELPVISRLLRKALLAELPQAIAFLMERVQSISAVTGDIAQLMDSMPPLVRVARYGNVRRTDVDAIYQVIDGLVARICIGLPRLCSLVDDDAANAMYTRIIDMQSAITLLQNEEHLDSWLTVMDELSKSESLHGLIAGRAARILLDAHKSTAEDARVKMRLAVGQGAEPLSAGQWVEGFLKESAQLLLLDDRLRTVIDDWVTSLREDEFLALVPLLRRTFSGFSAPERKQIGELVKGAHGSGSPAPESQFVDWSRAEQALPLLMQILGAEKVKT